MALNVVMLGPPGAGKGTQSERFARSHGLPKIATGDILREAGTAGTELGRRAKLTMDAGELVGDDVLIGIVGEGVQRPDTPPGVRPAGLSGCAAATRRSSGPRPAACAAATWCTAPTTATGSWRSG